MADLAKLFNPKSIAVVGASNDTRRIRGRVLANVAGAGFKGPIYPINPSSAEIQGMKAYPSILDTPGKVDLAIVALAAEQVMGALEDCVKAGVGGAIVFASGFAEGGDSAQQKRITDLAERSGMRIIGPNTLGYYNDALRIAATFSPVMAEQIKVLDQQKPYANDGIDIVCQSGGLGFALYSRALASRIPVRNAITTGNEADCEVLEIVEHLLDGGSRAILLFVEGFRNPERLERVAALAAERKVPLLITKIGRSDAGQRAAVSHTAHLTGSDVICDAVFARHGVIRVSDPEEMLAMAGALTRLPAAKGDKVAIITTSGGSGGWAADILSEQGLAAPQPSNALRAELDQLIPGFGSSANPIDVTAAVVDDGGVGLAKVIDKVIASGEFDAVLVVLSMTAAGRIATMRPMLAPMLQSSPIPIVFHSPGISLPDNLEQLYEIGGLQLSLRDSASALKALHRYGAFQQRRAASPAAATQRDRQKPSVDLGCLTFSVGGGAARKKRRDALRGYAIQTPPEAVVASAEAAVRAGSEIGFPLAMKIESADIPHKTDAGCVVLDVRDSEGCAAAYARIMENARKNAPSAKIDGVLLQKMMPPSLEMVVGMTRDPDFGPMIMLGFGGIYVEILRDSIVAPAPLTRADALQMIEGLKGSEILKGARGKGPVDIAALANVLVGLSNLVLDAEGAIDEADLNPVIVYPAGQGVSVVDYLFVPSKA